MLVVVSANSNSSPHVSREVDLAVEKAKPLLPVRVEDIVPTGSLDYLLRLAQWIDLFPGPIADHAASLQGMVGSMLEQQGVAASLQPAPEPPPVTQEQRSFEISMRAAAVLGALALISAVLVIGILVNRGGDNTTTTDDTAADQPDNSIGATDSPLEATASPDEPDDVQPPEPESDDGASPAPAEGQGTIQRVSVANDGAEGNDHSVNPSMSPDGRWVAFDSFASNLVEGDTAGQRDVFLHDRMTGETVRISRGLGAGGATEEANGVSHQPEVSADGRYVAFVSEADNLLGTGIDTNGKADVYLFDRVTQTAALVSLRPDGSQHPLHSLDPQMSDDGALIVYGTYVEPSLVYHAALRARDRVHSMGVRQRTTVNRRGEQCRSRLVLSLGASGGRRRWARCCGGKRPHRGVRPIVRLRLQPGRPGGGGDQRGCGRARWWSRLLRHRQPGCARRRERQIGPVRTRPLIRRLGDPRQRRSRHPERALAGFGER